MPGYVFMREGMVLVMTEKALLRAVFRHEIHPPFIRIWLSYVLHTNGRVIGPGHPGASRDPVFPWNFFLPQVVMSAVSELSGFQSWKPPQYRQIAVHYVGVLVEN